MYVPAHFAMPALQAREVLAQAEFGTLVSVDPDGSPQATPLPLLYDPDGGPLGSVIMHLARPNAQWRDTGTGLVLIDGPHSYISPTWYQHPDRSVPTWNYATVQVRGRLLAHSEPEWLLDAVTRLTATHEPRWSPADLDRDFLAGQLRAIVGVELVVAEVIGKLKLSQNKSSADIGSVIDALTDASAAEPSPQAHVAQAMAEESLPYANARAQAVEAARSSRTSNQGSKKT